MLSELKELGFIKNKVEIPEAFQQQLLASQSVDFLHKINITVPYSLISNCISPIKKVPFFSSFFKYIKTSIHKFDRGHSILPHSDVSPFSPWMIQLFYKPTECKVDMLFGDEDSYETHNINSGDCFIFYTFPSKFICSMPVIEGPLYSINILPCFSDNYSDNWIFKDANPKWN